MIQSSSTGPVRPVLEEEPPRRPRWQAAVAVALGLGLLIVVLWLLGRDGAVEETTVPTTLAAPTTTAVTTTSAATTSSTSPSTIPAVLPRIVAAPVLAEDALPDGPLVAVSAGEAWAVMSTPEGMADLIGHLEDGAWTFWHTTASEEEESGRVGPNTMWGLAVAPNGTVWAATDRGVFSFDGVEWTRRFDDPAAAVAVDEGGTVWITSGRYNDSGGVWLARWDGESWERVQWPPGASEFGPVAMAALPGGEVWVTGHGFGWGCDTGPLMHYDGTTLEAVEVDDRPFLLGGSYASAVEAAPNGDLWVAGFLGGNPGVSGTEPWTEPPVLARFDG